MSLTSYLTDPAHRHLREKFRTEFQRPPFDFKKELKASPLTKNYGIVGTAFDYVLRFIIEHHNKERCLSGKWVADMAFKFLEKKVGVTKQSAMRSRFAAVKNNYWNFLNTGKFIDKLFADALFLAKLDLYIRCGMIAPDLLIESEEDIQDLKNLSNAINIGDFLVEDKCFLNPTFGRGSIMVGGADADIILDNTLIDIKVTKHLKLERDYINQLIGYYILALIGGICENHDGSLIKRVGVYFARHGLLWTISLSDFGNSDKFESFKNWFIAYFDNLRKKRVIDINRRIELRKKKFASVKSQNERVKKVKS